MKGVHSPYISVSKRAPCPLPMLMYGKSEILLLLFTEPNMLCIQTQEVYLLTPRATKDEKSEHKSVLESFGGTIWNYKYTLLVL